MSVQPVHDAIIQSPSRVPPTSTLLALPQEIRLHILSYLHPPGVHFVDVCTKGVRRGAALCDHRPPSRKFNTQTFHLGGSTLNRNLAKLRNAYGAAIPYVCKTLLADSKLMFSSINPCQIKLKFCSHWHARNMWEALNGKNVRPTSLRIPNATFWYAKDKKETEFCEFNNTTFRQANPRARIKPNRTSASQARKNRREDFMERDEEVSYEKWLWWTGGPPPNWYYW